MYVPCDWVTTSARFRPWDKGWGRGGGGGGAGLQKKLYSALQFDLKIRGDGPPRAPPLDPPLTMLYMGFIWTVRQNRRKLCVIPSPCNICVILTSPTEDYFSWAPPVWNTSAAFDSPLRSLVFETPFLSKFPMALYVVSFLKQHHAICISQEGGNYILNSTVVSCYFNMSL